MARRSYQLSPFKEKTAIAIALFSLFAWHIMPAFGVAHAKAAEKENSQVFEIKSTISITDLEKQKEMQLQQQAEFAKIDRKVSIVRQYLADHGSPLQDYTEYLMAQDDWKTIIAISNSESNMCLHYKWNNCWGVGGASGLVAYKSMPEAIVAMQNLIDKRYKGMTLNQMDGVYVQPRSDNWLAASSRVYNDLSELEKQFDTDDSTVQSASTFTFSTQS